MLKYDEISSNTFEFDEVKSTELDNKTITCFEFIYTHPLIAIGGIESMSSKSKIWLRKRWSCAFLELFR